ncbi:hypothetical protein N9D52_06970 [Flavobacteriaceae bacterium]|nr:hypothetical protein [Flavobacteriaceae bacterium]
MPKYLKKISLILLLSGSLFSSIILFYTLQSFIGMFNFRYRNETSNPITTASEFDNQFTDFPPINAAAIPTSAIKGGLLLLENRYEEARAELLKASKANPYIGYSDYIMGNHYYSMGNIDSSLFYSKRAFNLWPKSIDNYNMINKVYAYKGDTLSIIESYIEIKDFFKTREEYHTSFIKYYSLAKYSYYDIEYADLIPIKLDQLIGEWVQVFNMKNGSYKIRQNKKIEFLSNGFFKSDNKYFKLRNNNNKFLLSFQNNPDKVISSFSVNYSEKWQTLVLSFKDSEGNKEQFFRRSSELDLPN